MNDPELTFEQWKATAVYVSDLRPFHTIVEGVFDDFESFAKPRAGYVFMVMEICVPSPKFHQAGYIFHDPEKSLLWCEIENHSLSVGVHEFDRIAKYLWDNFARFDYGPPETEYRIMFFDRSGLPEKSKERRHRGVQGIKDVLEQAFKDDENPEYSVANAMADLTRVGARFHEYIGGHIIALPLDE